MEKYIIISDSCQDDFEDLNKVVPFKISVGDKEYVDDGSIDIDEFIESVHQYGDAIKTSCPSPGEYMEVMERYSDAEGIFVITISSKLSGSYGAASLARTMFLEKYPDKKCEIIDSESAAGGEVEVYLKLKDLIASDFEFDEIAYLIRAYVAKVRTLFALEDMDHLIKNGRMGRPAGFIANVLSLRPIMRDNGHGEIELEEIVRGSRNVVNKLTRAIGKHTDSTAGKRLVISHCRAKERAESIKKLAEELYQFEEIVIIQTKGLSSGYAADGGIVIGFSTE